VARILNSPSEKFSAVEHLTLEHRNNIRPVEVRTEIEREWRKMFRTFNNLKTLRVDDEFVEELSRCLRLDDGGHPVGLLPELQELAYSQAGSGNARDAFIPFIEARHRPPRNPTQRSSELSSEAPAITRTASKFPLPCIFTRFHPRHSQVLSLGISRRGGA
jgi:hypothetical protein